MYYDIIIYNNLIHLFIDNIKSIFHFITEIKNQITEKFAWILNFHFTYQV